MCVTADKDHDQYRDDGRDLMRLIQEKCVEYDAERKLSIIVESIAGKITQTIDRLIALYRPDSLVVGTRGRRFGVGLVQGLGAGIVQGLGVSGALKVSDVLKVSVFPLCRDLHVPVEMNKRAFPVTK